MPKIVPEEAYGLILQAVGKSSNPINIDELLEILPNIPRRTLQRRLQALVEQKRLEPVGDGPSRRYSLPAPNKDESEKTDDANLAIPLSKESEDIRTYVRLPIQARKPVGYHREFLDVYQPNKIHYLSPAIRSHLRTIGTKTSQFQPAGTYARKIFERLLIDLSWNSSRLEGNTYTLLDTERLIKFGEQVEDKDIAEAQMILNHKDAIEMLVESSGDVGINSFTIRNVHAMLSNNLLPNAAAYGRLRDIEVKIGKSVYTPLAIPAQLQKVFEQLLTTAAQIKDEFEQAFFLLIQLPYLQPFEDVNKRVSRVAANIPLIRSNLCPLSFVDVPQNTYIESLLGIYEMNRIELMQDVFVWAYERSAQRYDVIKTNLGDPDPFRLKYRQALADIVPDIVKNNRDDTYIQRWIDRSIERSDQEKFMLIVKEELTGLHEGNIARYRLRPSEFQAWKKENTSTCSE